MEKRGGNVIAVDLFDNSIEHMNFSKKIYGYKTKILMLDILESDLNHLGNFDIVWATNIMQHIKPGHSINNYTKKDFIKVLKLLVKEKGIIICSSSEECDITILRKHFNNVKEFSRFTHKGFKVRTQTYYEPICIVVEIKLTSNDTYHSIDR